MASDTLTLTNTTALRFLLRSDGALTAAVDAGGTATSTALAPPQTSETGEPFLAQSVFVLLATLAGDTEQRHEVTVGTATVSITVPNDITGEQVWSVDVDIPAAFAAAISVSLLKTQSGNHELRVTASNPDGVAAATSVNAALGSPVAIAVDAIDRTAVRVRGVYEGIAARAALRAAACV